MLDPDHQLHLGDLGSTAGVARLQGAMGSSSTGSGKGGTEPTPKKRTSKKRKRGPDEVKEAWPDRGYKCESLFLLTSATCQLGNINRRHERAFKIRSCAGGA